MLSQDTRSALHLSLQGLGLLLFLFALLLFLLLLDMIALLLAFAVVLLALAMLIQEGIDLSAGYVCLWVGRVSGYSHVVQSYYSLHMADKDFFAILATLRQALVAYAVLAVVLIGFEGEAHTRDITTLKRFQQIVCIGGIRPLAALLHASLIDGKCQRTFAVG